MPRSFCERASPTRQGFVHAVFPPGRMSSLRYQLHATEYIPATAYPRPSKPESYRTQTYLNTENGIRKQRIDGTISARRPENPDFLLLLCDIPNHTR